MRIPSRGKLRLGSRSTKHDHSHVSQGWTTWKGTRGPKSRPETGDHQLFGFLTTDANAEVGAIHPKAMPVILRTADEIETWMTAPAEEALKLQRPLPNGALRVVMTGEKEDKA